jgi:hypothetical protein
VSAELKLGKATVTTHLKKLAQMSLIDRLPGSKIKWKIHGTLNWIHGGPLQSSYMKTHGSSLINYLATNFQKADHFLTTSDRLIAKETYQSFLSEMSEVVSRYRRLAYRDEKVRRPEDLIEVRWLVGSAPKKHFSTR